ncbi:DM13 domain-containing protein [uncultured Microbacterium sp.]|uniref:DM13 domain-containing protein n=1 Tax=uncultured Microbacterium sp. TaxID=191216 RepID=UPI0028D34528|nr:DM13 domain-containing protein [uncultured Microbacterium sp.]
MTRLTTPLTLAAAVLTLGLSLAGCATPADSASTNAGAASPMSSAAAMTSAPPATMATPEATTAAMASSRQGAFAGTGGKSVSGQVTIEGSAVDISGFRTDEGPDLHFYLANGTDDAAALAGVEIGTVSTDATQTIELPAGTTADMYTTLIVRCDKAQVVFGSAPLA